jgi:hypothetical protein
VRIGRAESLLDVISSLNQIFPLLAIPHPRIYQHFLRSCDTIFEIQVASVLMHAWSEVEHDLVYKPLSGSLSEEELAILDQINGLVMSGEIALELLQKAMLKRTRDSNEVTDNYALTNLIVNSLGRSYIKKLKLGNTKLISHYFETVNSNDIKNVVKLLKNVSQEANETISEQLLNMLMNDYLKEDINEKSLNEYFNSISGSNKDNSGFEKFVKTWIILEKAVNTINIERNIKHRKYFVPDFKILLQEQVLTGNEVDDLNHFRKVRNQLLHGIETPPDEFLSNAYLILKDMTFKVIFAIKNPNDQNLMIDELTNLK